MLEDKLKERKEFFFPLTFLKPGQIDTTLKILSLDVPIAGLSKILLASRNILFVSLCIYNLLAEFIGAVYLLKCKTRSQQCEIFKVI